jgi:alpha(1,3/1,4) fucosyltransferase
MFKKLLFAACCLFNIFADRIEIMPNGNNDISFYNNALQQNKIQAVAVLTDVDQYGENFKKNKTFWCKCLKKLHLENTDAIQLNPEVRKIVLMNIPLHFYRDYHVSKLPKEKMILFMWEPYIRLRKMYNPKLQACFSRIYTWDDDLVDNQTYFKFYYPVLRPMASDLVPFKEKQLCTLVSGCVLKTSKYPAKYPDELYSHRVQAIEFFERVGEAGFEFYGRGWEKAAYKSYRGACPDKQKVLKNYRFSICYENCQNVKGYITEKIFDCFAAGNVPVYWGASNVADYIPKNCFIDRRDFATLDDLYAFLKNMPQQEYEAYLERIQTFLGSEKAQLFSHENYEKIFLEAIQ